MSEVEKLCDVIGIIQGGKLLAEGTVAELRETYQHQDLEEQDQRNHHNLAQVAHAKEQHHHRHQHHLGHRVGQVHQRVVGGRHATGYPLVQDEDIGAAVCISKRRSDRHLAM